METIDQAIVLSVNSYQDNDNIVNLFTLNNGNIVVFAPGTQKIESKNRHSLFVGFVTEIEFFKARLKGKMSKLKTITKLEGIIIKDEHTNLFIKRIVSFLNQSEDMKEQDRKEVMLNYEKLLTLLEKKDVYDVLYYTLLFSILKGNNVLLNLRQCAICQKGKIFRSFSIQDGGFICRNCLKPYHAIMNNELLLKIFYMYSNQSHKIYNQLLVREEKEQLDRVIFNDFKEVLGFFVL